MGTASSLVVLMLIPLGIGLFVRDLAAVVVVGRPSPQRGPEPAPEVSP